MYSVYTQTSQFCVTNEDWWVISVIKLNRNRASMPPKKAGPPAKAKKTTAPKVTACYC